MQNDTDNETLAWSPSASDYASNPFEVMALAGGFDPWAVAPKPEVVVEAVEVVDVVEAVAEQNDEPQIQAMPGPKAMVYRGRVRSGQRLANEEGDLIVWGDVNPGAEIIAAGHIHVYGLLAGRAFAGTGGHEEANVFCQRFQAEIVSIAGNYRVFETIPKDLLNQVVAFQLENGLLQFEALAPSSR